MFLNLQEQVLHFEQKLYLKSFELSRMVKRLGFCVEQTTRINVIYLKFILLKKEKKYKMVFHISFGFSPCDVKIK